MIKTAIGQKPVAVLYGARFELRGGVTMLTDKNLREKLTLSRQEESL